MSTIAMIAAVTLAVTSSGDQRPVWATESVSDTVVALVERAIHTPAGDERKSLLREAERHARASVAEREEDVGRRYALAVVLGLRAESEGAQAKVRAASDLSKELDRILTAAPEHAGARHMLGRLHAGVRRMNVATRWIATNLLGGDELKRATWDAAEANLTYAERHAPRVADHHLQLARLYRDTGRREEAVEELRHLDEFQATSALEEEVLSEATALLSEWSR